MKRLVVLLIVLLCMGISECIAATYPKIHYMKVSRREDRFDWSTTYVELRYYYTVYAEREEGEDPFVNVAWTFSAGITGSNGSSTYKKGYLSAIGSHASPSTEYLDFSGGGSTGGTAHTLPGTYNTTMVMQLYNKTQYQYWSAGLTEEALMTGGDYGSADGSPTGGSGDPIYVQPDPAATAADHTWWEDFWASQSTMSESTQVAWKGMIDNLKTCGPWGQSSAMAASVSAGDDPIIQNFPDGFYLKRMNSDWTYSANQAIPMFHKDTKLSESCMTGDSSWSSSNPWFTTNPNDNTVGYWLGGLRKLLQGFVWIAFTIAFVAWVRGRITA